MEQNTEETPTLTLSASTKRVVLEHTNGPYAGLRQILGTTDDYADAGEKIPSYVQEVVFSPGKRTGDASLIRSLRRHILYREVPLQVDSTHYPIRVR